MTTRFARNILESRIEGPARWFYLVSASSLVFILDRVTKFIITENLFHGQSIKIIPNIFHITLVLNKGVAFGLFKSQGLLFVSAAILAIAFIMLYIWKNRSINSISLLSLAFILGGASGNLLDRVWLGNVIDFLDFRIWPVFNIADTSITIGVAILALNIFLIKKKKHN